MIACQEASVIANRRQQHRHAPERRGDAPLWAHETRVELAPEPMRCLIRFMGSPQERLTYPVVRVA